MPVFIRTTPAVAEDYEVILPKLACLRYIELLKNSTDERKIKKIVDPKIARVLRKAKDVLNCPHFAMLVTYRLINLAGVNLQSVPDYIKDLFDKVTLDPQHNGHHNMVSVCVAGVAYAEDYVQAMNKLRLYAEKGMRTTTAPTGDLTDDDDDLAVMDEELLEELVTMFVTVVLQLNEFFGLKKHVARQIASVDIYQGCFDTPLKKKILVKWVDLISNSRDRTAIVDMYKAYGSCWLAFYCPSLPQYHSGHYQSQEPFFRILKAINRHFKCISYRRMFLSLVVKEFELYIISHYHADQKPLIKLCRDCLYYGVVMDAHYRFEVINFLACSSVGRNELDILKEDGVNVECAEFDSRRLPFTGPVIYRAVPGSTDLEFADRFNEVSWHNVCVLDASHSQLSSESADLIAWFPRLRCLSLRGTNMTDEGIERLIVGGRQVELLDLSYCNITDRAVESLKYLKKLRLLFVYRTYITPNGAAILRQLLSPIVVDAVTDPTILSPLVSYM